MTSSLTPESLLALIGGFPDRPNLDPTVLATEERDGNTQQLVEYTTYASERVQAYVLHPANPVSVPTPAIVAIHQDGGRRPYDVGKSEVAGLAGDPTMAYGYELCRRGYVVICPDRFGFESRCLANTRFAGQFVEFQIQGTTNGVDYTEDLFKSAMGNRLLFEGWTKLGLELFELTRAVDWLAGTAEGVDPARIGAIGHSAGGHLVPYLMYLDDRVGVGCASCGTWFFSHAFREDSLRPMQGFGGFSVVPGMAAWGDTDDVLAGIAPRPYWEHRGDFGEDFRAEELTRKARDRYAALGVPERFRFIEHDAGHVFPVAYRERAYDWFDRWL